MCLGGCMRVRVCCAIEKYNLHCCLHSEYVYVCADTASPSLLSSTPCKINPSMNSVLSARKPHREETPLKRVQDWQAQHQAAGAQAPGADSKPREQSMYCKELLFNGATEFCIEELRAMRYHQKHAQRLVSSSSSNSSPGDESAGASAAAESCRAGPSSSGSSH